MNQNKDTAAETTRQHLLPVPESVFYYVAGYVNLPQLTEAMANKRQKNNPAICMAAIHTKLAHDLVAPLTVTFLQEAMDAIGFQLVISMKEKEPKQEIDVLDTHVDDLDIANRTRIILIGSGFWYLGDITSTPGIEFISRLKDKRASNEVIALLENKYQLTFKANPTWVAPDKRNPAEPPKPEPQPKPVNQSARIKDLINRPIEDLKLMLRSQNCLKAGNVFYIGQLVQLNETQLLKFINIGRRTAGDIIGQLEKFGLQLGMQLVGWHPPYDKALLDKEISHLNLSTRANASLKSIGVFYIGNLVQIPQKKLYSDDAISQRSYEEIAQQVEAVGLSFGMTVPDWTSPTE